MPRTSEMIESKFLRKEDIPNPVLWTTTGVEQRNTAMQGAGEELKWCLFFQETDKPLVLNSTNIHICEQVFGSDDTDDWIGKIVLYVDPNVTFGGKLVGGIRLRKPKQAHAAVVQRKRPVEAEPDPDDFMDGDDDPVPF